MASPEKTLERLFDEMLNAAPSILADVAEEPHSPFLSDLQQREKRLSEISLNIQDLRKKCCDGYEYMIRVLSGDKKQIQPLLKAFSSLRDPAVFTRALLQILGGSSWREALKISSELLSLLYSQAKAVFERGFFEEASNCFTFLSWFDAKQYDHWMGLGHAQFHSGSYTSAIDAYAVAAFCLPDASRPLVYTAACFEAIGDLEQANIFLSDGLQRERKRMQPDRSLLITIEKKIEEYKRGTVAPTT